ncbi:MAG: ATP-binding cassette domain-containing protein [Eubacteriales bacterium]|nr:ATP-binding cassette domain-containing protein [Eubacteriales bacterium]
MLLEIKNVTKSFYGMVAINNLSLDFEEGQLRCIIGPNGSGKTTLYNLITGYFQPTSGKVIFDGKDITKMSIPQISRLGTCRKFQNPNIFGDLTVEDNLRVAAISEHKLTSFFKITDDEGVLEQIDSVLQTIQLSDKRGWHAGSLSHGEKQWLEIGMVLIKKPRIILLDEPTAGMTSLETSNTSELIRSISSSTTCIVIEHDLDFIRSLNGRVTVLNRGEFLAEGTYDEIAANRVVRDVYLGDEE